jgi:IS30 family transposase
MQSHGHELGISESTLRRMVNDCNLDARNLDLRSTVQRKVRRKRNTDYKAMNTIKDGHKYEDYLAYMEDNDVAVVQMDCVEGAKTDNAVLLTLHFTSCHLQLALILDDQTTAEVVAALDKVEETLGPVLFSQCFPVILTDNGHEFADIEGIERSVAGGKRTKVFFCEPRRSDEKGACENNHKYIRYILPSGSTLEPYDQTDISLMMDHVNSFMRASIGGMTPYQMGRMLLPEDFFLLLGLTEIEPDKVLLKPSLLKKPNNPSDLSQ